MKTGASEPCYAGAMERKEQHGQNEGFPFSERERLFNRISDARFQALVFDAKTSVHRAEVTSNVFGEFLFVTASRPFGAGRTTSTFYGLGYHDQRERWIVQEWFWYPEPHPIAGDRSQLAVAPDSLRALLQARRNQIATYLHEDTQTRRGQLFELLADLTDEDGALSEMEDLEALGFDFDDEDRLR